LHEHAHPHPHGHAHGLVDASILRSRAGIRAVALSLGVLTMTAVVQSYLYATTLSVALLADVIHNFGDALTAVPLGIAFFLRSSRGERLAGLFVVATIFVSACVALAQAIERFINPRDLTHLVARSGGRCRLCGKRARGSDPNTGRTPAPEPGPDRRREPRTRRRSGQPRRARERGSGVDRTAGGGSADRACHHARDPQDHPRLMAHGPFALSR
jgi:hypothetical protein